MIKLLIELASAIVISILFFGLTDPNTLPVGLLMIPILLVFISFYLFARVVLYMLPDKDFSSRMKISHSILIGAVAAMIMLFQSTGGIVWTDVILMGLLIVVGYFYINRL